MYVCMYVCIVNHIINIVRLPPSDAIKPTRTRTRFISVFPALAYNLNGSVMTLSLCSLIGKRGGGALVSCSEMKFDMTKGSEK